jgi:hypothetical protein
MRRTILILSFCLLLTLLFALHFSAATLSLRVNEKATRLDTHGAQSAALLAVENSSGAKLAAKITVELLDTKNEVKAKGEARESLAQGKQTVRVPLPFDFDKLASSDRSVFPWYRLRYTVTPEDSQVDPLKGVISLSEIMTQLFELRLSAPQKVREGTRFGVRVRAEHPFTSLPVAGVELSGRIELDDPEDVVLAARSVTDAEGFATLDFNLPKTTDDEDYVDITGRLEGFEQTARAELQFDRNARILLSTDKPLYQPGQTLHLRALVFDASRRAMPQAETSFEIKDPDSTTVFRATIKTSRFGVASVDWRIPDATPLGDYSVRAEMEDADSDDYIASQQIKISRYDLPNFSVSAKADRAFYMQGQNAEVLVRADYLFGQPVTRGKVKVVRETERRWSFKKQQWETNEGEKIEGELDGKGSFPAHINLDDEYKDFEDESYARFQDLTYAAYITDATTNRTEQRRFTLRLTKEPVHVYLVEGNYSQAEGVPLSFFVATSYPDGTPAECEVSVRLKESEGYRSTYYGQTSSSSLPSSSSTAGSAPVVTVRTNRYGVAKITGPPVTRENESGRYLSVNLLARDSRGRTGHHDEDLWIGGGGCIRVETDKAIYREGEPVRASLVSNRVNAVAFVDVVSDMRVIRSEAVRLEQGRGSITFPYGKDFDGRLSIVASFYEKQPKDSYYDSGDVTGHRTVLYPHDRELKLDVRMARPVYRPGEEAEASLRVNGPDGRALESVLGVVIFDKAVEERARTDQEFSSSYGFYNYFHNFWYGSDEVGGVTLRDLERLNTRRQPVTKDLNLAADLLLQNAGDYYRRTTFESDSFATDQAQIFDSLTRVQAAALKRALDARYSTKGQYPSDEATLRRYLREARVDFDAMRDPWEMPYRVVFSINDDSDVLDIMTSGADKVAGTGDDFSVQKFNWPYFRPVGERLNQLVHDYHTRTGGFIRDDSTLQVELMRAGIRGPDLIDRWGAPYRFTFGSEGTLLYVKVESSGPDHRFDKEGTYGSDDFIIWTTWIDSFEDSRAAIEKALNAYLQSNGKFPQDESSFRDALKLAGVDWESLRDPFNRAYLVKFKSESRYVDRVEIEAKAREGGEAERRTKITPVSQRVYLITMLSAGEDARPGTGDDFNAATFTSIAFEQAANDANAQPVKTPVALSGASGALTGTVTDISGSVVPGATVVAVNKYNSVEYKATTDDEGKYILRNLPSGYYTLTVTSPGFATFQMNDVPVRSSTLIKVDATLNPAGVTSAVVVTSGADLINSSFSQLSVAKAKGLDRPRPAQVSTPRLREYFPETLVWQPALETDKQGRALLRFKLADNITTWKMSVIGSTESGEIGTAEKEIRAFQPFFVEHDPPRVLTEGDEIALPVVLRNYLDRQQSVELQLKPEQWFSLSGEAEKRAQVPAGDAAREIFNFRATQSITDGKQRITAIGADASDAIERAVTVHPDGEERAATDSRVFTDRATLEADIPTDAIDGTLGGELKIYPNLIGHVFESIEGILHRPYGCGEQTVSSTYPSLLILRAYKRNNVEPPEKVAAKARRYLQQGYERLLNYRADSGGFSYWGGRAEADLALTAYALRFLHDAGEFIEVDDEVVNGARQWLVKEQRADGSWPGHRWNDNEPASAMTTALIARSLALDEKGREKTASTNAAKQKTARDALLLALAFLSRKAEETDEPYLIASYALASLDAGEDERAKRAIARLRTLAHDEGDGVYWSLETNTPFYGWGLAGRIETSALVLQALVRGAQVERDALVNGGLLFLLRQKDRYGVWYSTQATINVLDALVALLSNTQTASGTSGGTAEIIVNGQRAGTLQMPPARQLTGPLSLDISKFLSAGQNRVEVVRAGGVATQSSAQLVSSYYLPWPKALADETKRKGASALALSIDFDKTQMNATDEVACRVKAERVGHSGYGMMLAEIGLPPGADVDRASLELAMKESGWSLTRYDVLPDRLIVYLWPRAGGTDFTFKFRPRYGLRALTAPSVLYDYYNPEARTTLAPVRFVVRSEMKN